jgi:hypothetical protein
LRKVTVPLATAAPSLVTVAVNITLSPGDALVEDELKVVTVLTWGIVTVTKTVFDTEAARIGVAPKVAVIKFEPSANLAIFNVAIPLTTVSVPRRVPPSRNVTRPVLAGLPPSLTVALRTTLEP